MLTARTVRRLHPAQVAHRVRLRSQKALLARLGPVIESRLVPCAKGPASWPERFRPLAASLAEGMPGAEANAGGRFEFLRHACDLGSPVNWNPPAVDRLWYFHLHYFEWAWAFAAHPDQSWARTTFGDLWRSWKAAAPLGAGDAWAPYVAALRSWVLCGVFQPLVAGGPDEQIVVRDLHLHAWFLRHHLERDVGGNHLIKNLKALIGLGVFLGDEGMVANGCRLLARQVEVQVLGDGGHYERSPSYHCQVLEDLLDVAGLLGHAGLPGGTSLGEPIGRMRRWLATMLMPDGDVPLFNDGALVGRPRLNLLEPGPRPPMRLVALADSGYVVIRPGPRVHLVVDVGIPCPPSLPAHAHADCLSFELAVDGNRVVVDSGTSTYEAGRTRDYERSTAAHNTVEIDGQSQIEIWGAFRVGRRAQPTLEQLTDDGGRVDLRASHDGYRRLPGRPDHHRWFQVSGEEIVITDDVTGSGRHRAVARLHLRSTAPVPTPDGWRAGPLALSLDPGGGSVSDRPQSSTFGSTEPGPCLELAIEGELPLRMTTQLRLAGEGV